MMKMVSKRKRLPYYKKGVAVITGTDITNYSITEASEIILPFYFHDSTKMKEFINLGVVQMSKKAGDYTTAAKFSTQYLFPELKRIAVPTLVVVGDDDFICDKVSEADRIAKDISSSTEIVIKDAGHFCWFEQPKQFYNECEHWLQKQGLKNNKAN